MIRQHFLQTVSIILYRKLILLFMKQITINNKKKIWAFLLTWEIYEKYIKF